jgi:hypothetical protein
MRPWWSAGLSRYLAPVAPRYHTVDALIAERVMDLDDTFGHWLAGVADSKAKFAITRVASYGIDRHHLAPSCRFEISFPAQDHTILAEIRDRLGAGSLYLLKHHPTPHVRLAIHRNPDCVQLVEVLRRYPLRSPKRRQFDIWARAVEEIAKGDARSDQVIVACRAELTELQHDSAQVVLTNVAAQPDYGEAPECLCGCGRKTRLIANSIALPHPSNPDFCSFARGHAPRGAARPTCLCGCGRMTSLARHPASRLHPENPSYCSFVNGHQNFGRRAGPSG